MTRIEVMRIPMCFMRVILKFSKKLCLGGHLGWSHCRPHIFQINGIVAQNWNEFCLDVTFQQDGASSHYVRAVSY